MQWTNVLKHISASGDQIIITSNFFQQTKYVKRAGTTIYAWYYISPFASHSFAPHATKINTTNIQSINSRLSHLISFLLLLALGREAKYTRENMKLPIADTERDIKAEWWFRHKATTTKKRCERKQSGIQKLKSHNLKFARPGQSNCSVLAYLCF